MLLSMFLYDLVKVSLQSVLVSNTNCIGVVKL